MKRVLFITSLLFFIVATASAQLKLERKTPPPEMETLNFLIGKWTMVEDQWYDAQGNPLKIERAKNLSDTQKKPFEIAPIMGGLYLEGGADGDMVRSYFFYQPKEKKYFHIAIDFMGAMSLMTGEWQGKKLVLTDIKPQVHPEKGSIMWRRIFFDIKESGYSYHYEASLDEGKTWQLRGQQSMQKSH